LTVAIGLRTIESPFRVIAMRVTNGHPAYEQVGDVAKVVAAFADSIGA
jgi:hypothetical protein